jgi:GAF domain-containing protein
VSNYLACSSDTKSEIVVLIRAGDDIFGQIDIDSSKAAAFSQDDESALQSVADKLAEQLVAERR